MQHLMITLVAISLLLLNGCSLSLNLECGENRSYCPADSVCIHGRCVVVPTHRDDADIDGCSEAGSCDSVSECIGDDGYCPDGCTVARDNDCCDVSTHCDGQGHDGLCHSCCDVTNDDDCCDVTEHCDGSGGDGNCWSCCDQTNDTDCCDEDVSCEDNDWVCEHNCCNCVTDTDCCNWVKIFGGTFEMGSPISEDGRDIDEVLHRVTLTRDFEIQATEVTQLQFEEIMGYNESRNTECTDFCPVEWVNWHEAAAYCNELSSRLGLELCYECAGLGMTVVCVPNSEYSIPHECPGYRLPTEAEWEYAARSGTIGARYGELDSIAWYEENSDDRTHPVGEKVPSPWGLYDMLGNVAEWCHDYYGEYTEGSATDPSGPRTGLSSNKLARGGFYYFDAKTIRAADRYNTPLSKRGGHLGFRPLRSLP